MRIPLRRMPAVLLLSLVLLAPSGCDSGREQLQRAEAQYTALTDKGVHPKDPAWDAVIAAFEAVPAGSRARPEADRRLAVLREARKDLPPRPLATPGSTGPGATEADVKRAACEALAKRLGQTQEPQARAQLAQALAECRAALVRLEAHNHPPGEHTHEHPGAPPAAPGAPQAAPGHGGDSR